jgi:hypothetical protein
MSPDPEFPGHLWHLAHIPLIIERGKNKDTTKKSYSKDSCQKHPEGNFVILIYS